MYKSVNSCLQNAAILFFLAFFSKYLLYLQQVHSRRIIMPKIKEQVKSKVKTEPKKLSKAALWWKKHPNGLDVIIHDMRAVMR
jgi:5,10-methenyltetrahydromethanopterin hydrogenase